MRKPQLVIGAIGAALALTACSTGSPNAAVETVYVTQEAAPPDDRITYDDTTIEAEYLSDLAGVNNSIINRQSDADLIDMGYTICETLDAGYTVDDIIEVFASDYPSDNEIDAYSALMAAALVNLCPEYQYQVGR